MTDSRELSGRVYIDHLDGIRCLAVILVVLFHSGFAPLAADFIGVDTFTPMPGGFIGVDVFFVLSGFLMTRILLGGQPGFEGIKSFFIGRCRRIVPAYMATLLVCALVSAALFLPVHLQRMWGSLVAAPFFLSNFVFWKTTDYFSQDLAYNPLLHTWSLAVEWQFYLLYPLLFLLLRRRQRLLPWAIGALALVSFACAQVLVATSHTIVSFYMLPTRIWEFAVGGLLVFLPANRLGVRSANLLSAAGLATILACAWLFSRATPFPGAAALLPCLGAAALIHAGGVKGPVHALLTCKPVADVGKWSYSVYLWHWPLLVFLRYTVPPGHLEHAPWFVPVVLATSLALGWLSWKFIENPFRQRRDAAAPTPRPMHRRVALAMTACLAIAATMAATDGLPFRFSPQVVALSDAYKDAGSFRNCLSVSPPADGSAGKLCRLGTADAPITFMVFGDSHGAALAHGISSLAAEHGRAGLLSVSDSCAPLVGLPGGYLPSRSRCERAQQAMPRMVASLKPREVFLHAAWPEMYDRDPKAFVDALDRTLRALSDYPGTVYVIGDTPGARDNVPLNLAKQAAFGTPARLAFSAGEIGRVEEPVRHAFETHTAGRHWVYIDLGHALCDEAAGCRLLVEGQPLYWDRAHLTGQGSDHVARLALADLFSGDGRAARTSGSP